MSKLTDNVKGYVKELGERETEHRKYSSFYLTISLKVTESDAENEEELLPYIGKEIVATGMWDDTWGDEIYDWRVFSVETSEEDTEARSEFRELLSHLNAEDNSMALDFLEKHLKPKLVENRVEVHRE